ncbi:MAG: ABC transporter ATP-binding protein, partial [Micrococcales bacterium]
RRTLALSGGQLQRLALAGALADAPSLLLLDEPTSMLDPPSAAEIRSTVEDVVTRTGCTLFVVEHRMADWLDLLDYAVLLGPGGVVRAAGGLHGVLRTHRDHILASGTWLPGAAPPVPVAVPEGVLASAPTPPGTGILAMRGASARRGETVIEGADLVVRAGQVQAVCGPSGSGKTTTLSLLIGLVKPHSGTVSPATARLPSPDLARLVSYVPQHPSIGFMAATVGEEVRTAARHDDDRDRDGAARAEQLLDHFGLSHLAGASPYTLSGGEQRRLALATALMGGTAVLALDEPTIGQDRHTWAAVAGALRSAAEAGSAVVVATHDPDLVAFADARITLDTPSATTDPALETPIRWYHRCRPLTLLSAALIVAAASLLIATPGQAALAVAIVLAASPLYSPPPRVAMRRLLPVAVALISVGWSSWLLGGHDPVRAAVAMARIGCMVAPGVLLMAHIRPSPLGDDLAQRARLPARAAVAATVALHRLDQLQDLLHQLTHTRRLRGRQPRSWDLVGKMRWAAGITFSLLVESLRSATTMAVAMDARGFARAGKRSWAQPSPWRGLDSFVLAAAAGYAVLVGVLRWA